MVHINITILNQFIYLKHRIVCVHLGLINTVYYIINFKNYSVVMEHIFLIDFN